MLSKSEKVSKIKQWLNQTELDPTVNKTTLGIDASQISPQVLLSSSAKLIKINKNEAEPDDRDNLKFSKFMGIEDFVEEHIQRDAGKIQQKAAYKMQMRKNLSWLTPGFFSPQIRSVIVGNSLANNVDGINPLEHWDNSHKTTKMGPGGIPCYDDKTEVLTKTGFKYWHSITENDELAINEDNHVSFTKPIELYSTYYEGLMYGAKTERIDYLVTPCHNLYVSNEIYNRHKKEYRWSEFKFEAATKTHNKKRKHTIALDFYTGGNSPKLINIAERDYDFNLWAKLLGYYLADGYFCYDEQRCEYRTFITKLKEASPIEWEAIKSLLTLLNIKFREDTKHNQFVINGKEFAHYFSQFGKSVDKFVPNIIMEGSTNIRSIFFNALTYFDSAKKTEYSFLYSSASSRLAEQIGWLAISLGYAVTYMQRLKLGENMQYQVLIQNKNTAFVVNQHSMDSYYTEQYKGNVYCAEVPGHLLFIRRNGKTMWNGNSTDAIPPECYDKETKVFTKLGWVFWNETNNNTEFACNINGELQFHRANKLIKEKYEGELLGIKNRTLDILVTPNHRMWCRKYRNTSSVKRCGLGAWQFINMSEVFGKPREFIISHQPYTGFIEFNPDMAELVGWYISEGYIGNKKYKTRFVISQSLKANPEKTARIGYLLAKLNLNYKYSGHNFYIKNCRKLRDYLANNCGIFSANKTIPEEALYWSIEARTRLLDSLISGDGHTYENNHRVYHSTSQTLITQIIRLAISLGYASKQCKTYPRSQMNSKHKDGLSASILTSKIQGITHTDRPEDLDSYYKQKYNDYVYCAQVPGELLLVCRNNSVPVWLGNSRNVAPSSFGFFDPVHISETEKIGVNNYIAHNVAKGKDLKLYRVMKTKDGLKWMDHEDILNKQVHIPEF